MDIRAVSIPTGINATAVEVTTTRRELRPEFRGFLLEETPRREALSPLRYPLPVGVLTRSRFFFFCVCARPSEGWVVRRNVLGQAEGGDLA